LLYGLAHLLIEAGATDPRYIADHTAGFEAFAAFVGDYPPDRVARETGLDEATIRDFAIESRAAGGCPTGGRWGSTRATKGFGPPKP